MPGEGVVSREEMRVLDTEARRLAQAEFRRPLVVEAGAGTGKTTTLATRIVAWSLGPGWQRAESNIGCQDMERVAEYVLGRVVAITFTEAAASEMSARVGEALAEVERGSMPCGLIAESLPVIRELSQRRARALLGCLDRLAVMTIHAFCRRLLAKFPIEAGVHPSFEVDADGIGLDQVIREVVEDAINVGYGEPGDPHLLALAVNGYGPQRIADALTRLAAEAVPPEVLEQDPFSPLRLSLACEAVATQLQGFLDRWGDPLQGVRRSTLTVSLVKCMEATVRELRRVKSASPLEDDLTSLRKTWTQDLLVRLKEWGRGKFNKSEAEAIGPWRGEAQRCASAVYASLRGLVSVEPHMLRHACAALAPLLRRVRSEMRARGIQTFAGLLQGARDLLASHSEVRSTVRRSMDQLLVDEFQDTDSVQCDVIRMIALEGPIEERPGLFVVGDPKQSIYGWRNAELEAYEGFVSEVLGCGGQRLYLSVNFRSAPAILEEVDRIVAPLMVEEKGVQPAFQPLLPCDALAYSPGFSVGSRSPVEYWVSWALDHDDRHSMDRTPAKKAAKIEAEALAREILTLHSDYGVPWQEIGVLFRTTGDLETYLSKFREFNIPYVVERDKNYYRRREVIEAAALFRCIVDPHDQLALVTLLRSPMVGVPDAAWIPLWRKSFPEMVTELRKADSEAMERLRAVVEEVASEIPPDIPGIERIAGWEKALISALEDLAALRESFEVEPADLFVMRMRSLFMQEVTESARYLGLYRVANLERFFRQLTDSLEQGAGDLQSIVRALRVGTLRPPDAEEGRPKGELGDAVQVMTIHKAKGLDFRHVFVMQLHRGSKEEDSGEDTVVWDGGQWEWKVFGLPTLGFERVLEKRRRVAQAELVRTLYVATTRAKERLVLCGRWPRGDSGRSMDEVKTHMDLLQWRDPGVPALEDLFKEEAKEGRACRVDEAGVRWVFLDLLPPEPKPAAQTSALSELPTRWRVENDLEALRVRAMKARTIMGRPFSGPASMESHEAMKELMAGAGDSFQGARLIPRPAVTGEGVGLAVGSAIHRALEGLNLHSEIHVELQAKRSLLPVYLGPLVEREKASEALDRARQLWDRFAKGPLLRRLLEVRDAIIARELPILLPPDKERGPVGFIAGAIDLLYRDPDSGRIVVADFKTDHLEGDDALRERSRIYGLQTSVYVRAVREALALRDEPRAELWFLHPGRIVVVGE